MLHYGRGSSELPQLEELCSMCWLECMGTLCLSTGVTMLIWLLHSGHDSGNLLPKSCKDVRVEEECMKLILIALETRLKSIHFLLLLFFHRVKLVLLVLLVLAVVLEREENLVLRVMLGHPGLRYVNTTWELRSVMPLPLHKALHVLWFSPRLTASVIYMLIFSGPSWKSWKPWQQGWNGGYFSYHCLLPHCVAEGCCLDWAESHNTMLSSSPSAVHSLQGPSGIPGAPGLPGGRGLPGPPGTSGNPGAKGSPVSYWYSLHWLYKQIWWK